MTSAGEKSGKHSESLRHAAEQRVPRTPADVSDMSADEIERLVYELEVHQEELEIQNEELRRTHLDLQESNDRFSDLYDFAPVGYLTLDAAGTISKANLTSATMLARDRSKIIGSRMAIYCDSGSRRVFNDHVELVWSSRQRQSCEVKFANPNGTSFYARLDSNYDALGSSEVNQIRMVMTDITSRKKAELALAEKDKYLRSIADSAPVLICYIDTDHRFQFSNAAFHEWFGISPDFLIGQSFPDIFGEKSAQEILDYLVDVFTGHRVDLETVLTHQSKGQRHVHMMLVPDIGADGRVRGLYGLTIDISERKIIEQQNARRRKMEEQLSRLSANERDVFDLLIRGKSNKEAAFALDIGLRTAERRRQIVFDKLEVQSVSELLQQLADIQGIERTELPE